MRYHLPILLCALTAVQCGGDGDDNHSANGSGGGGTGADSGTGGSSGAGAFGSGGSGDSGGSGGTGPAPAWTVDLVVEEALGPFDSWVNVVSEYGAVGDGVADDTAAIQAGLDDINSGAIQVLRFPAGTYRLTNTLHIVGGKTGPGEWGPGGAGLIGDDPTTTTLKWDGPAGAAMLLQDGGTGYRYERLTWDGSKTAGYGVAEWWDATQGTFYGGSDEHQDEVFRDMAIGIMAGRLGANYGQLDSEGQIRRVRFIDNTYAGLATGSFNALDWWVFESSFEGCARGVTNTYSVDDTGVTNGAGAMYVYRSNFTGSTVADVDLGNNGWFSLHDNVSIGSKLFIQTATIGDNPSPLVVQRNRVVTPGSATPITFGSAGALMLVDNEIESSGPPFSITNFEDDTDVLLLGNTFTSEVPSPSGAERFVVIDNQKVAVGTIAKSPLALPTTPAVTTHAVFEVPLGASTSAIQDVIDAALASDDPMPIVHFAKGNWDLDATLQIPANDRVQFVGDGWQSQLHWVGSPNETMIHVAGPTRFWMRDMRMLGQDPPAVAIAIDGADQAGGRILVVGSENGPIRATDLQSTRLALQANPYIGITTLDGVKYAVSMAAGPFDVLTMKNGSNFEMCDSWYEGPASSGSYFQIADGTFTYLGGHFAPAAHGGTQTVTPVLLDGSKASASFIAMQIDLANVPSGIAAAVVNELPETRAYFFANSNATPTLDGDWFSRPGSGGEVSFLLNRHHLTQYPDQGDVSDDAVRAAWAQARALPFDAQAYQVPDGATDVNLYRLDIPQTGGLVIQGG